MPMPAYPETSAGLRDGKEKLRLWLKLLDCTHLIERQLRGRFRADFDITLPRFDVLAALDRFPEGLTMGGLSRRLRVSQGNVTGVVERLLKEGEIRRWNPPGDRRTFYIALTEQGQRNFDRMAAAHQAWIDELLGGLAVQEISQLQALLSRAKASVEAKEKSHGDA
ncbi:MAG: MarR family transcriptional regulator [Rhodovibrionaceae bacterium]